MNNTVFNYRLTCFNGAAPCVENDKLSLAICKRDMRRVIGNQWISNKNNKDETIWFFGIVGYGLARCEEFPFQANDIFYIAKLTEVKTYACYFGDTSERRKDKIYIPCENGLYVDSNDRFSPKASNGIHDEKWLWDRDWDVRHNNGGKYVLISKNYHFLESEESKEVAEIIKRTPDAKVVRYIGHRRFIIDDQSELIKCFNRLTMDVNEPPIKNQSIKCGKDRAK